MTNAYYVSRLRAGDKSVFSDLFTEYYKPLCSYAHAILHDEEAAKDVVMDVFTKLYSKPTFWNRIEDVRGYLGICLKNRCLELIRKEKKRFCALDCETELLNLSQSPEAYLRQDQRHKEFALEFMLAKLPRKRREVFTKYYLENMTYTELATSLGLASGPNTVKRQLALAKQTFLQFKNLLQIIVPVTFLSFW